MTPRARSLAGIAAALVWPALVGCGEAGVQNEGCPRMSGVLCTIAGTGVAADKADGLPAAETTLYLPQDVAVGPDGLVYIVDWNNHRIRVIRRDRTMKVVAGVGELGVNADDPETGRLNHPTDVVFDGLGRMVIAAWHNSRIKRVDLGTGELSDICGTGKRGFAGDGGPAVSAVLDLPVGVVYDAEGNLYISDQANRRIRRVDTSDVITTVAGSGLCLGGSGTAGAPCFAGDGGSATEASFNLPGGQAAKPGGRIAIDGHGSLYLADTNNHRVRKIDAGRTVSTVVGSGLLSVTGMLGDGGPAVEARLNRPADVAVGPDGSLYVADTENSCVRRVGADGIIETVAGICCSDGAACYPDPRTFAGHGGPATLARLNRPYGITLDEAGNLYIADTHNHRIHVVWR